MTEPLEGVRGNSQQARFFSHRTTTPRYKSSLLMEQLHSCTEIVERLHSTSASV